MELTQKLAWVLIVLGCAGIFLSVRIGREISYYQASDVKRWVAIVLFFGGAILAIIGASLLE